MSVAQMRTLTTVLSVAISLAIGFGCGWLVAQSQSVNKVSPSRIWTDQWISDVMLLTGGGHNTTLFPPDKTQSFIVSDLNTYSLVLGLAYDDLPAARKQEIMFYIPAARAIATTQHEYGSARDRGNLLTFLSCIQKVKSQGGLVKSCIQSSLRNPSPPSLAK